MTITTETYTQQTAIQAAFNLREYLIATQARQSHIEAISGIYKMLVRESVKDKQ